MTRELPNFDIVQISKKSQKYCVGIPIINEGDRFKNQLQKMVNHNIHKIADIIIFDGNSTDGSTQIEYLKNMNITALLVKKSAGKQGTQLRMGFSYCLDQGYEAIITIDGNDKDSTEDIPHFIAKLNDGFDFIQGSRYVPNGKAINTPLLRHLAVKLIHSPWISLLSGFHYTDTTNGFRAIRKNILLNKKIDVFRSVFISYELLFYMSIIIPKCGYRCIEIPVTRKYPKKGKTPSKISIFGNVKIIYTLILLTLNKYNKK